MLAARMYGINDLRVEEIPKPRIGPDEILVKVRAAAICGTDVRMLTSGAKGVDETIRWCWGMNLPAILWRSAQKPSAMRPVCGWRLRPIWAAASATCASAATGIYAPAMRHSASTWTVLSPNM